MDLTPVFASFVAVDLLNLDNDAIEKYCRQVQKEDEGRNISNQGGWQSSPIQKTNDAVRELYISATSRMHAINKKIGYEGPHIRMQAYWININGKNHYNQVHDHPSSFYAGVYYVRAKEGQGKIIFNHPMTFFSNYTIMNKVNDQTMFNSITWEIEPKEGMLLLFPSYLAHLVGRNMTEEDRISIAFNFGADWSLVKERNGD